VLVVVDQVLLMFLRKIRFSRGNLVLYCGSSLIDVLVFYLSTEKDERSEGKSDFFIFCFSFCHSFRIIIMFYLILSSSSQIWLKIGSMEIPTLPYNFPFFSLMKHLPVTIVSDRTPMPYELDLLLITPFIKLKFHSCAVCIYSTSFKNTDCRY
jgi:hypothetical protein